MEEAMKKEEKAMKVSEVREKWREAVDTVAQNQARIRIERSGMPIAGLVSAQDLEWLALRDQRLEELREVVSQMREAFADVPEEEIEAEVTKALAEVRRESRAAPPSEQAQPA
jgi:PHD/YefM family antitoxin component YafN of YafNO toxin-antitoxin module